MLSAMLMLLFAGCANRIPGSEDISTPASSPEALSDQPGPQTDTTSGQKDDGLLAGTGLASESSENVLAEPSEAAAPEPSKTVTPDPSEAAAPQPLPSAATESSASPNPAEPTIPDNQPQPDNRPQQNKSLSGRIIVLDPGHQSLMKDVDIPIAPGETETRKDFAIGTRGVVTGVFEYEVVLDVAIALKEELEVRGAQVILTRETHDVLISNADRAQIANDAGADALIRIHCDGAENQSARGISVLYPGSKYIKDEAMLKDSLALSKAILKRTVAETKAKDRGVIERNDLVGFNYCRVPCTLIEMGFMTNPEEDRLLNDKDYQMKLVRGIAQGIQDYLEEK